MTEQTLANPYTRPNTGVIVFPDGEVLYGYGVGKVGSVTGEVCFNTSLTGYQEILTDPSYAQQIICFTFPHIGIVGTNDDDVEATIAHALGLIMREDITAPSNYRAHASLEAWLTKHNKIGITGIDTRALTIRLREHGAANIALCHAPDGVFDINALQAQAASWAGLDGLDLTKPVMTKATYPWQDGAWQHGQHTITPPAARFRVVAVDYGIKQNILRELVSSGCDVTVVAGTASATDILAHKPDGVFLSNGPGDPAATGKYTLPELQKLIAAKVPLFGICLGFQLLSLALGARSRKMHHGHRGANHPVKDLTNGRVEITSQNHGFEILAESLPQDCRATHVSLFDGTLEGFASLDKPLFAVQYHPEASPGPHDSHHLFHRFVQMMERHAQTS